MAQFSAAHVLASRYARALFSLAQEKDALDQVANDLSVLDECIKSSQPLRTTLRSPIVTRAEMVNVVSVLAAKLSLGDMCKNLLILCARKRRLAVLQAIIAVFMSYLAKSRGEIVAEVTSSSVLSAKQKESLLDALRGHYGKKLQLREHVDTELIGGLVVRVGSQMIDRSVRTSLRRMTQALKGA